MQKSDINTIKQLLKNERCIAAGECGLDYDRMFSTRENQIAALKQQIEIAEELNKPMFLHERAAVSDFISIFSEHSDICEHSVVHCFTGTPQTLACYIQMGFYIGITGWICDDRRADNLRIAVPYIPLNKLLIETDSPYLTPRSHGLNSTNTPCNLVYVIGEISRLTGKSVEEIIAKTKENTERLFKLF